MDHSIEGHILAFRLSVCLPCPTRSCSHDLKSKAISIKKDVSDLVGREEQKKPLALFCKQTSDAIPWGDIQKSSPTWYYNLSSPPGALWLYLQTNSSDDLWVDLFPTQKPRGPLRWSLQSHAHADRILSFSKCGYWRFPQCCPVLVPHIHLTRVTGRTCFPKSVTNDCSRFASKIFLLDFTLIDENKWSWFNVEIPQIWKT